MLRRADVIRAYELARVRRAAQSQRQSQARLDAFTPAQVQVVEVVVEAGCPAAEKRLSEIPFPAECVVVSVRRGTRVLSRAATPPAPGRRADPGCSGRGPRVGAAFVPEGRRIVGGQQAAVWENG